MKRFREFDIFQRVTHEEIEDFDQRQKTHQRFRWLTISNPEFLADETGVFTMESSKELMQVQYRVSRGWFNFVLDNIDLDATMEAWYG